MNRRVKIYGGPADGQKYVTDAPYFEVPVMRNARRYSPADMHLYPDGLTATVRYIVYQYGRNEGVAFPEWVEVEKLGLMATLQPYDTDLAWRYKVDKVYDEFWKSQDRYNCHILEQTIFVEQMRMQSTMQIRYSIQAWAIKLFPLPELVTLGKRDHACMWTTFGTKRITDEQLCRTMVDADPDPEPSTEVVRVGATERRAAENQGPVGESSGGGEIRLGGRAFGKSDAAKIHRHSES